MHTYHTLGIVRDEAQAVLYGVEACLATIGKEVGHAKAVLLAQRVPVVLLRLGQHKDDGERGGVFMEALYGAHEHWSACYGQKLLGHVVTHAEAFAACHYYYVVCGGQGFKGLRVQEFKGSKV